VLVSAASGQVCSICDRAAPHKALEPCGMSGLKCTGGEWCPSDAAVALIINFQTSVVLN